MINKSLTKKDATILVIKRLYIERKQKITLKYEHFYWLFVIGYKSSHEKKILTIVLISLQSPFGDFNDQV